MPLPIVAAGAAAALRAAPVVIPAASRAITGSPGPGPAVDKITNPLETLESLNQARNDASEFLDGVLPDFLSGGGPFGGPGGALP